MDARLQVFKALGDNTRYAIYLEVARASSPKSTAEVADALGLHPNTVRPHLERMREVGLLGVEADSRGSVGRPQHRYCLAPDAPGLGLEPPAFPMLAKLLAGVAGALEPERDLVSAVSRPEGAAAADARLARGTDEHSCLDLLVGELGDLGFDPAVVDEGNSATIAFSHCPFREVAEQYPEVVCQLHRGLVEGFVNRLGGAAVTRFGTLIDRDPCQVELGYL